MIDVKSFEKEEIRTLDISSEAFGQRTYIPPRYTCDGENINPPIDIGNIPKKTKSLVLIMEDPDSPKKNWTHWLEWNIPPAKRIQENHVFGIQGINDFGQPGYGGPCPNSGTHHYHFKVYALKEVLEIPPDSAKQELEKAMTEHIIAFGELIGLYKRAL